MLTDSATQPKFFRNAAIVLLAIAAWFSAATLATAQDQNQDQSSAQQSQRTDSGIQSDVAAALQQDTSLQGQRISAKSDKGVVTLTGNVQTEAQSQQAETDAANVAGVSGILNQLKVQNAGSGSSSAGIAAQNSANQLNPDDQNQPQAQGQNSIPPPPPDEAQPQQPQQAQQQTQQPEQPYGAQGPDNGPPPPPDQQGYGAPPSQAPYYETPMAPVTIPAGTLLRVRLDQPLDTAHLQDGTIFQATNAVDVYERGVLAIPRGAALTGRVVATGEGGKGKLGGSAVLSLQLTNVNLAGRIFPLVTDVWSTRGPNKAGYTASNTAGGAVLGAIIGGIIGRGAGAAIGAGVGAAGGLAASEATHGPHVILPVESQVDFHLAAPATVQPVSWREAQRLASSAPRPPVLVQRPRRTVYVAPPPPPYYGPYPYPY
ncbi:MAG TPA: BON domain-containing protein [Acidobacteriaceae bacterium]|jgi:hypothetical protein|nr:BON domain-containing protein [Acidobacteriaceae bacterium]